LAPDVPKLFVFFVWDIGGVHYVIFVTIFFGFSHLLPLNYYLLHIEAAACLELEYHRGAILEAALVV
jgi:hypothetical protein